MMLANEIATNNILLDDSSILSQTFNPQELVGTGQIESRFGKINVDYDKKINIERGLLGMADKLYFCITNFPIKKFAQFQLLQSLEEHSLSLIIMPILLENNIVERADLLDIMQDLSIAPENCDMFLVVNVYRDMNNVRISVNARAPIFIDKSTKKGEQSVLRNNKYMVRHMITNEISS